jgi:hypothetical protein
MTSTPLSGGKCLAAEKIYVVDETEEDKTKGTP